MVKLRQELQVSGPARSKENVKSLAKGLADGRGFEPLVPFGTHAFQACTIDRSVTHPGLFALAVVHDRRLFSLGAHRAPLQLSKLQASEQFVERQLNADEKLAEVRVFRAHRIETHLINDRFDLKGVARKKSHAPLRVIETGRTGDELFYFPGKLATDCWRVLSSTCGAHRRGARTSCAARRGVCSYYRSKLPANRAAWDKRVPVDNVFIRSRNEFIASANFSESRLMFCSFASALRVLFFRRDVFAFFREREITVNRR